MVSLSVTAEDLRLAETTDRVFAFLPQSLGTRLRAHGNIPRLPRASASAPSAKDPVYTKLTHSIVPNPSASFHAIVWDVDSGMKGGGSLSGYSMAVRLIDDSLMEVPALLSSHGVPSYILHIRGDTIGAQMPILTYGDVVRCHRVQMAANQSYKQRFIDIRMLRKLSSVVMWDGAASSCHTKETAIVVGLRNSPANRDVSISYSDYDDRRIDSCKLCMERALLANFEWLRSKYFRFLDSFRELTDFGDIVVQIVEFGRSGSWMNHRGDIQPRILIVTDHTTSAPFGVVNITPQTWDYLENGKVIAEDGQCGLKVNDWIRLRNMVLAHDKFTNTSTGEQIQTVANGKGQNLILLRLPARCRDVTKIRPTDEQTNIYGPPDLDIRENDSPDPRDLGYGISRVNSTS
eukprot:GHVQ01040441.1.p1 GENE.GHVQ01040441.1~~GHVQ01040441.1.p1  ORF type:complete len:404 (-),score=22.96 GHVQ01040441.1:421-1632(-)